MGDFFKAVTSGVARHVFAWLLPSAVTIGVVVVLVEPSLSDDSTISSIVSRASSSIAGTIAVLVFATVLLAVVSAYLAQVTYRVLEGYRLPRQLRRHMQRRHARTWWSLHNVEQRAQSSAAWGLRTENMWEYPERLADVMPTRLGNALRAAEQYGVRRWNLDSLTFWHELTAVAPAPLLAELDDSRSAMDFFAGSIVQFGLIAATCFATVPQADDRVPLVVGIGALVLIWPAYLALIQRVGEYRSAIQALVNLGRKPLAEALGYPLPADVGRELYLWANLTRYVRDGDPTRIKRVDRYRESDADLGQPAGGH